MKKNKKVALYNPYLDTLGGGEKHTLFILKVLEQQGYDVNIFWDIDLSKDIQAKFNLSFKKIQFLPNLFAVKGKIVKKLKQLSDFDIFFYVTDGSYFFSPARHNFVYCMVPDKKLYPQNLITKLKLANYSFITISHFTKNNLNKWGIKTHLIYPYIDDVLIQSNVELLKKDDVILSVGRFFPHLHSKRQDILIDLFNKLKQKNKSFNKFKLIIVGGLKEEDIQYFNYLKSLAANDPSVIIKSNISYSELITLYKKAKFYWHLTGYGVDEKSQPERVEHLGITPLEAMAAGCITFAVDAGGPRELIADGETGFLFNTDGELIQKMTSVFENPGKQAKISSSAHIYVKNHFSYEIFKKNVHKLILSHTI